MFRKDLYEELKEKGLLTREHLFKVVRKYSLKEETTTSYVCGDVVSAMIRSSDYPVVEYVGPNASDALSEKTPPKKPAPKQKPKSKSKK